MTNSFTYIDLLLHFVKLNDYCFIDKLVLLLNMNNYVIVLVGG